jgi:hypothetical protein
LAVASHYRTFPLKLSTNSRIYFDLKLKRLNCTSGGTWNIGNRRGCSRNCELLSKDLPHAALQGAPHPNSHSAAIPATQFGPRGAVRSRTRFRAAKRHASSNQPFAIKAAPAAESEWNRREFNKQSSSCQSAFDTFNECCWAHSEALDRSATSIQWSPAFAIKAKSKSKTRRL